MKPLTILVSLITEENDFQMEQAAAAAGSGVAARRPASDRYAPTTRVNQSQQLFTRFRVPVSGRMEFL